MHGTQALFKGTVLSVEVQLHAIMYIPSFFLLVDGLAVPYSMYGKTLISSLENWKAG